MKLTFRLLQVNGKVAGRFMKTFRLSSPQEVTQIMNAVNKEVVYKKLSDVNNWYQKLIGLDEVKLYQDRVIMLQERLLAAQEKRRMVAHQLSEIRKKSNELQDRIHKVKRQDDLERFLELMKEETEVLKQEHDVNRLFLECDRDERDTFTAFTNAVRDSHEKQRAQVEYTKYFGLVLSIAGSFLAFCYSTINKQDLKRVVRESIENSPIYDPTPILAGLNDNRKLLGDVRDALTKNLERLSSDVVTSDAKVTSDVPWNEPFRNLNYWTKVSLVIGAVVVTTVAFINR